jgi:hypothetical protein
VGSSSAEEHLALGSIAIGMEKGCNHVKPYAYERSYVTYLGEIDKQDLYESV